MSTFLAVVEFDACRSLADLAVDLARATGINLEEEQSGRFDEVPAFVGSDGGAELTLFGPPDDSEHRKCVLEVMFDPRDQEPQACIMSFLTPVFVDAAVDSRGYIDCSVLLANLLRSNGFADCQAIQ